MILSIKHVNLCSNTTGVQILWTTTEFTCVFHSMRQCSWKVLVKVELTVIWPLDRFWPWNRSRGPQNTFQVSVRISASPRTVWAPQIQKVIECLASIIKFMIFRNLNFWIFKKPLTVIWTLKFFESFPDWSDPKRVCPYIQSGSRNRFAKSTMCVYP